jgi:hypothetical protein
MPTIELTDEQAEELKDLLASAVAQYPPHDADEDDERAWLADMVDADKIQARHRASVLSDILHLLEIA